MLLSVVVLGAGCRAGDRIPSMPAAGEAPPGVAGGASAATPMATLPIPALGYNAREGKAIFLHYCVTCHGEEGHGDGFNAYNLDPKPRDLADAGFQAKRSDDDLASVIRSGGSAAGLSTGMPPWGRTLNERQVRNLVDNLRTWRAAAG
jgi:mono/diheme cytochrome c family protein